MRGISIFAGLVGVAFLAAACSPTFGGSSDVAAVGPSLASDSPQAAARQYTGTRLDVVVPVFNPGLPEDSDDYEKENIWPELRRAEANRFALNMKSALYDTGVFGDVVVSPDATALGDLYVIGEILESNGEDVSIQIEVVDISGQQWLKEEFSHRVKEQFHKDRRNEGLNPYVPVFEKAAVAVVELLHEQDEENLAKLRVIQEMRWGQEFAPERFGEYAQKQDDGIYQLVGRPDEGDPDLARTRAIYQHERAFMSVMQEQYEGFASRTDESYEVWQEQSFLEAKAQRKAKTEALQKGLIGGAIAIAGAFGLGGDTSNSGLQSVAGAAAVIAGGSLIAGSFQSRAEMQVHAEALSELNQSLDLELGSQVMEFEDQTVKLSGDARKQHLALREWLKKIYAEETAQHQEL